MCIVVRSARKSKNTDKGKTKPRVAYVTTFTGSGNAAKFAGPRGVAIASDGTVYVADTGNHRIRKIEFR